MVIKTKSLLIVLLITVFSLMVSSIVYSQVNILTAVKTDKAPVLDGKAEEQWNKAQVMNIQVFGGANMGSSTVSLKSVYTGDSIYFLAQWADPTQSERRSPWQKQSDGSWIELKDPNDKGGDNNLYYEDKLAFVWNINDSIANFNTAGCFVTCHAGEPGKPYGNKYTSKEGELGDIWHWKGVRTGPVGQIDDQYLDHTRYDKEKSPEAGRKSDPKTGGGYADNQTDDKKAPKFALAGNKPAPPYWIMDSEKEDIDDSRYNAGDEVPGIIIGPFIGDRGDIPSGSVYANGKWTLEWGRKLNTGSKFDVQFTDTSKSYFFGVAVFDNAQVRHAFSTGALQLKFSR